MAEMPPAARAQRFGTHHSVTCILFLDDRCGFSGCGKARPARSAIEFRLAVEQGKAASGAQIDSIVMIVVKPSGKGGFRSCFAQDKILLGRKPIMPFGIAKIQFFHTQTMREWRPAIKRHRAACLAYSKTTITNSLTIAGIDIAPMRIAPVSLAIAAAAFGLAQPLAAQDCALCGEHVSVFSDGEPTRPVTIEIDSALDFDRFAMGERGGGEVMLDPHTGQRSFGGMLVDLGGFAVNGSAIVRGDPGRAVRIDLPEQITLHTADGDAVELRDLRTDLPAQPRLDPNGELRFAFGGRLRVGDRSTGNFRGRIRISAEYE